MKYLIYSLFILGILGTLVSCNNDSETRSPESINVDSLQGGNKVSLSGYSQAFNKLVKNDRGIFRGVNLGAGLSEVQKLEDTTEIEEQASDHIDYMVYLPELETAEVRYLLDRQKVSTIEVNIYPNSEGSQDSLFSELNRYFEAKYGKASTTEKGSIKWESKQSDVYIEMEKKGTEKVHDISIVITSLLRQSALILLETLPENQ